ncbi:MAG: bifunctional folylpolyglutamate synthase/dihydrofolate synthase [Candidatus Eremiobacteraeota bacterium]|nr:bifunctional folylpolyglutamate synthase/dihydrofolate synthase [Candidatus Eremiobacteraeota bacterium]
MEFETALRVLDRTTSETISGRFPGRLDRMRSLLRHLGDPQESLQAVHVGGSAGKGSTATMCAAILQAAGFKAGLHTKPHLHSVTERARIDGQPIAPQRFGDIFDRLAPVIEVMRGEQWGPPSYFELMVALSFLYFAEEKVDVAVIEVGVGGTLDGTNVITPLVSIITNVGTDHQDVLGDTVEEIAKDKAGIIKDGVPVVTAATQDSVLQIITEAAQAHGAPLSIVARAASVESSLKELRYAQEVVVRTERQRYAFTLPLIGEFQVHNAATALVALEAIADAFTVQPVHVTRGFADLSLPGRTEYYPSHPSVLFDVAHNVEKAQALGGALQRHFPGRRMVFVVAIAREKDFAGVVGAGRGLPAR